MNNITSGKVTSYTEIEFRSLLLSEIKAMLLILDRDEVPPFDECNRLQSVVREYASYLSQKKAVPADPNPPFFTPSSMVMIRLKFFPTYARMSSSMGLRNLMS